MGVEAEAGAGASAVMLVVTVDAVVGIAGGAVCGCVCAARWHVDVVDSRRVVLERRLSCISLADGPSLDLWIGAAHDCRICTRLSAQSAHTLVAHGHAEIVEAKIEFVNTGTELFKTSKKVLCCWCRKDNNIDGQSCKVHTKCRRRVSTENQHVMISTCSRGLHTALVIGQGRVPATSIT